MSKFAAAGWVAIGAGLCALVVAGLSSRGSAPDPDRTPNEAPAAPSADELKIDASAMAHGNVRVAPVLASHVTVQKAGFARVLDVGALAAIDADATAADATAMASRAEATRLATLYAQDQSASRRSLEAAQSQARADIARAQLATRRVGLEFGPGLMRLGPGGVSALVSEVAAGRAALVRIDIPGVSLSPGSSVRVGDGVMARSVRVLGAAAATDAKLQTAAVLAIVRGSAAQGLLAGRVLPASADGAAEQTGVIIPRDAIVRYHGGLWIYAQKPDKSFDRVELVNARPVADGWFVPSGVAPGTPIAVAGAGSLMAMEHGSEAGKAE